MRCTLSPIIARMLLTSAFLLVGACSLDRGGLGPSFDSGIIPPDATSDARMDGAVGCPPGQVDANGDPSDGCEYACTPTASPAEVCDGVDNDCDPATEDGADEPTLLDACDGPDTDLCQEGHIACTAGVLACDDTTGDIEDVCNDVDDDCDPSTPDGAGEIGVGCDGDDPDLCAGGFTVCVAGVIQCDDPGGAGLEICDGVDNDCDPATPDGSADPMLGDACDGLDADLCKEGAFFCASGALSCDDTTGDIADICNGLDDDCDPSTADGSADPMLGDACDGADRDLCAEGVLLCASGALSCDDTTGDIVDICDGVDNDCDPSTADGSADPMLGSICDGPDADLCQEGTFSCVAGALSCNDMTGDALDICDGLDNDCRPGTPDGSADPMLGVACDGPDADLCKEGTLSCGGAGTLVCDDTSSNNMEICDGVDNDCRPGTPDGVDDALVGVPCDGPDADLCKEGNSICSGGVIACNDATGDNLDVCDGVDNDCRPGTADGVDDPFLGDACDGPDSDFCLEGVRVCSGGSLVCNDTTGDTLDVCDGVDNDCNPLSADGSDEAWFGVACDGPDTDLCTEGVFVCTGMKVCTDTTGNSVEVCDGLDNDCDGSIDEGGVCSGCTTVQHGGHAYLFCGGANWQSAQGACRGLGNYDLVTINDPGEQTFVLGNVGSNDYWIGLNDRASEGTFVWSDGSASTHRSWGSGEPNDGGIGQDCVELYAADSHLWHDRNCVITVRYICESQ